LKRPDPGRAPVKLENDFTSRARNNGFKGESFGSALGQGENLVLDGDGAGARYGVGIGGNRVVDGAVAGAGGVTQESDPWGTGSGRPVATGGDVGDVDTVGAGAETVGATIRREFVVAVARALVKDEGPGAYLDAANARSEIGVGGQGVDDGAGAGSRAGIGGDYLYPRIGGGDRPRAAGGGVHIDGVGGGSVAVATVRGGKRNSACSHPLSDGVGLAFDVERADSVYGVGIVQDSVADRAAGRPGAIAGDNNPRVRVDDGPGAAIGGGDIEAICGRAIAVRDGLRRDGIGASDPALGNDQTLALHDERADAFEWRQGIGFDRVGNLVAAAAAAVGEYVNPRVGVLDGPRASVADEDFECG